MKELIDMLVSQMSPDNALRTQAEDQFRAAALAEPDTFLFSLAQVPHDASVDPPIRLAATLHLKRYVPLFWSPAFDNYVGPSTTNQEVKAAVRQSLLKLLENADSKLRNTAAVTIVEIASVDYPEEWPDLLYHLDALMGSSNDEDDGSSFSVSAVLGALAVLGRLLEDIITFDRGFQSNVVGLLKSCEAMLTNDRYPIQVKVATLPLFRAVIETLQNMPYQETKGQRSLVDVAIPRILELLSGISSSITTNNVAISSIMLWQFKGGLYECLNLLLNSFSRFFKSGAAELVDITLNDLTRERAIYLPLFCKEDPPAMESVFSDVALFQDTQKENSTPADIVVKTVYNQIGFLQCLLELHPLSPTSSAKLSSAIDLLASLNVLTVERVADYQADFNEFVTDETDLAIECTVRAGIVTFFTELNEKDTPAAINELVARLMSIPALTPDKYVQLESLGLMLTCAFDNEAETDGPPAFALSDFLKFITSFIRDGFAHLDSGTEILVSRLVLMLPKFLIKYANDLKPEAVPLFTQLVTYLDPSANCPILKSAVLISFEYFNQLVDSKDFAGPEIQLKLMTVMNQLKDDSQEDANIMMLETLGRLIRINNRTLAGTDDTFLLILAIGCKDCSNFSLNTPTLDCVKYLIQGLPVQDYMVLSSKALGHIMPIIERSNGEYLAEVDFILQVLAEFLKGPTENFQFPHDLFQYVFPPVCRFIVGCRDDQLLQSASTAFNEIVSRSSKEIEQYRDPATGESGNEILLKIVAKFLAPDVSDQAIVNLGSLVILIIDNFSSSDLIKQYFVEMLSGVTVRLLHSKEVPTIENMILIFNKLMISSPASTLEFLKGFALEDGSAALAKILPVWFQAFEAMRGYDRILDNVKAFAELLKLNDPALAQISVQGDILPDQIPDDVIVTRSMSKTMQIQYESIPADAKVVRLLAKELKFQLQSAQNADADAIADAQKVVGKTDVDQQTAEDAEDSEWEDVDDVGVLSYQQLRHYVENGAQTDRSSSTAKEYLVDFFKGCFAGSVGRFHSIYDANLSDDDKKLLTETLVF